MVRSNGVIAFAGGCQIFSGIIGSVYQDFSPQPFADQLSTNVGGNRLQRCAGRCFALRRNLSAWRRTSSASGGGSSMSMAAWQCLATRMTQTSKLFSQALRAHHSVSLSPQCLSAMGAMDSILFPRVAYPEENIPDDDEAAIRNPFMQLMAVPKRKVSPSRKGKRNGPKALKPVPVVAKCRVCGRIKLPHFYCCSGEAKVEEI